MLRKATVLHILMAVLLVAITATSALAAIMPQPNPFPRANAQAVWANGKVHWVGGTTVADVTDAIGKVFQANRAAGYSIYNPTNNTWESTKWDVPTSPKGIGDLDGNGTLTRGEGTYPGTSQTFAYDYDNDGTDEIFIHAGYPSFIAPGGGFWRFDPNNGADWQRIGTGEVSGRANYQYMGIAVQYGGTAYCMGGLGWGTDNKKGFSTYSFATNTWSAQTDLPFSVVYGVGAVVGNKIYVLGGEQSTDGTTTQMTPIWAYDTSGKTWTKVADLQKGVKCPAVAVYNSKIYVMGGQSDNGDEQTDIQVFNTTNNAVTKLGNLPVTMCREGGVISPAGMLYVGGGSQNKTYSNLWWKADLTKTTLTFNPIAADPASFPYQDWEVGGADFTGTVLDPNGTPIPGAIIGVKNSPNATADAQFYFTADQNGNFKAFVKPGTWYAAAWKDGCTPSDDTQIESPDGGPISANLTITQSAGVNVAGGYSELYSFSSDQTTNVNVVDNNLDSVWESDPASGPGAEVSESFYIEFPGGGADEAVTDISGVTLYWNDKAPADYSISWSNEPALYDENWTELYSVTNATGGYNQSGTIFVDPIKFTPVTVRTLRITVTKLKSDKDTVALREIAVHSASKFLGSPVTGIVKDEAGNPIEGALVHLGPTTPYESSPAGQAAWKQVLTDADGKFSISWPEAPAEEIDLTADAFGYKNQDTKITLSNDGSFSQPVEFVLPARQETSIVPNWNCEQLDESGKPTGCSVFYSIPDDADRHTTFGASTENHTPEGSSSFVMQQTGKGSFCAGLFTDFIPVVDDGSVSYNVWMYYKNISGTNEMDHYFAFYDANKNQIGLAYWYGFSTRPAGVTGWWRTPGQNTTYRMVPPPGSKYMKIISERNGSGDATIAYDDIIVEEVKADSAIISGTVKDEAGNPIVGALVHLGPATPYESGPAGQPEWKQIFTDANGKYSIKWTTEGRFDLTADALGYANKDKKVTVSFSGSASSTVNFILPAKQETSLVPNWNCEQVNGSGVPVGHSVFFSINDPAVTYSGSTLYNHTPSGNHSFRMTQTGSQLFCAGFFSDYIPVVDDGTVGYNVWMYYRCLSGGNDMNQYFAFYDANKNPVEGLAMNNGAAVANWYGFFTDPTNKTDWWRTPADKTTYRMVPPAGAKFMRIISERTGGGNSEILFDDIVVEAADLTVGTEPDPFVKGTVKDESGNPIAGALVHLGPAEPYESPADPAAPRAWQQILTDADGNFVINYTVPGEYDLTADALGYANQDTKVTIYGDGSSDPVSFVLPQKQETSIVPNWNCEQVDANGVPVGYSVFYSIEDPAVTYSGSNLYNHTPGGSKSFKLTQTGNQYFCSGMFTDFIPVVDDGSVGYNVWMHYRSISGSSDMDHYFAFYDADKNPIGLAYWYGFFSDPTGGTDWWRTPGEKTTYRMVPPAGAKFMKIISERNNGGSGEILFDDVVVEQVPTGHTQPPVVHNCENIADVKSLDDGTPVTIAGKQMTAVPGSGKLTDTGYIEETNRSSGIKLDFTSFLADTNNSVTCGVGTVVNIEGTVTTINGEKAIDVTAFTPAGGNDDYAKPVAVLGMNNRFANAPLATGLYVKLWGKVLDVQADNFTITDGSETPVVVYSGDLAKPGVDDVVRVKGILSKDADGTTCLIMNPEQVEWVDASAATQPLPIQSYNSRTIKPMLDWQVLGPFQKTNVTTAAGLMGVDFISEATGGAKTQANIRPTSGMTVGSYSWTKYHSQNSNPVVDMGNALNCDPNSPVVGYLHTYVWSPVAKTVDLCVGTDELMDVWVNGSKLGNLYFPNFGTPAIGGNDYQGVHLNAGYNSILVKVANTYPSFCAAVEIIESNSYPGHPYPGAPTDMIPVEGLGYSFDPAP